MTSHLCRAQLHAGATVFTCGLLHLHLGEHRAFGPGWSIRWYPNAEGAFDEPRGPGAAPEDHGA